MVWSKLFVNLSFAHGTWKSRLRLCRLSPMFSLIIFKTSVQAVLPSGQCIHVARQLDNADVTDHYQQMLVSCFACISVCRLKTCKPFGCDWLMSPNKDETGLSLPKTCGLMIELVWSNLWLTELCSWHMKVQASALLDFRQCFIDRIQNERSSCLAKWTMYTRCTAIRQCWRH